MISANFFWGRTSTISNFYCIIIKSRSKSCVQFRTYFSFGSPKFTFVAFLIAAMSAIAIRRG